MKLSAVIVVYLPELKKLISNIKSCIADVDALLIYQNSLIAEEVITQLAGFEPQLLAKMHYLGDGSNIGIAAAMNAGVIWSEENGCTHLLTLDQDSAFAEGALARYKDIISISSSEQIGIYGVNSISLSGPEFSSTNALLEVTDTISSGSIYPLSVFKQCGLFKAELFIDAVDYEFCYRVKRLGYKTVICTDVLMNHELGYPEKTRFGFSTVNYSAFRTYYILRNQIAVWRAFPDLFQHKYKVTLVKDHLLLRSIKIVLAEKDKINKLRAIIVGTIHGLKGRTGYYKI
jgi:rhamnosyltransferase